MERDPCCARGEGVNLWADRFPCCQIGFGLNQCRAIVGAESLGICCGLPFGCFGTTGRSARFAALMNALRTQNKKLRLHNAEKNQAKK
jgi:hypothetical protein